MDRQDSASHSKGLKEKYFFKLTKNVKLEVSRYFKQGVNKEKKGLKDDKWRIQKIWRRPGKNDVDSK